MRPPLCSCSLSTFLAAYIRSEHLFSARREQIRKEHNWSTPFAVAAVARVLSTSMPKRSRAAPQSEAEPEPEPDDDGDGMGLPTSCLDSCIRLEVTHVEPNYSLPWQYRHQTTSTSTGFIISGNRILTNAHCVDNFAVVKVKKRGDANKYIAEVVAIARDCDLALLTVTDRAFWSPTPRPIVLRGATDLPRLQDVVTVVGFPVGGDNMSITEGVVSRIDMQVVVVVVVVVVVGGGGRAVACESCSA